MGSKIKEKNVKRNPFDLTLSPYNVRKQLNEKALEQLVMSVNYFEAVLHPIVINTKNQVVAGQRRWLAAKEVKLPFIYCIVKEYDDPSDEIKDSLVENQVRRDLDSREKGEAIIYLHDERNGTFEEIAEFLGMGISTIHRWYREATGPEALQQEEIEIELEQEKAKEEKKLEKKEKEKKSQPTIYESTKDTDKLRERNEAKKKALDLYHTFGMKTGEMLRQIIDSNQFKDDMYKIMKLLEYTRDDILPLRTLTDIYKDIKIGLPADLDNWKELHESDTEMRTVRARKILMKKLKPIMKRRRLNFHHVIEEALVDYIRKWSLEEDWETEVKKEIPEAFK